MTNSSKVIVDYYEDCLQKHGDSHQGVAWPKYEDTLKRYRVMLDCLNMAPGGLVGKQSLLDFGCGTAHLKEFMDQQKISNVDYSGLDISENFVRISKQKFPENVFYCMDVKNSSLGLPEFNFAVLNGTFTVKCELSFEEMWQHTQTTLGAIYPHVRRGLAVNFMSKHVDWEREDLFHLPFDTLTDFLRKNVSRNFVIRQDYGLFEFTAYIYR